jgi:hypothetical protein
MSVFVKVGKTNIRVLLPPPLPLVSAIWVTRQGKESMLGPIQQSLMRHSSDELHTASFRMLASESFTDANSTLFTNLWQVW